MQITHLGHSAVLVESSSGRLLIDPGNFAADRWAALTDLDAVLITHQHPDHVDPQQVPGLLAAHPGARVLAEPQTAELPFLADRAEPMAPGAWTTLAGFGRRYRRRSSCRDPS